jgi:DNA-binding NarL/FixJ family response regulator
MPWGGGDGVLTVINEEPQLAVSAVILLASGCRAEVLYNIARFTIADYLQKPLGATKLAQRIRKAIANRRLRTESASHV